MHARIALHSIATVTGIAFVLRTGLGSPWWILLAWYVGTFLGAHAVMVPFMAAWYMATGRIERWIRGIIEEEMIRVDLRMYDRLIKLVAHRRSDDRDSLPPPLP
jgi:hypothetical protein